MGTKKEGFVFATQRNVSEDSSKSKTSFETEFLNAVRCGKPECLEQFINTYPDSNNNYIQAAQAQLLSINSIPYREPPDIPDKLDLIDYSLPSYKFLLIEGGNFEMGSDKGNADESPVHDVQLNDFLMGETEVSQELWEAIMGNNPSKYKGENYPVESISYVDCQAFIQLLNAKTGLTFRLPTEAEWEYAAGGGKDNRLTYSATNNENEL